MRLQRLLPWLTACAYLASALLYNALIPLGEGPDEIGHLRYAVFLAEQRRLPTSDEVPGEGHQPPLGYLPAAALLALDPGSTDPGPLRANPDFRWNGGTAVNAFERGSLEAWPWQGLAFDWHLARLGSTIWGLLTLAAVWAAARRLSPDNAVPATTALLLVATTPQWLFGSALVSNDTAAAALGGWLLWAVLPTPRRTPAWRWALGAGTLLGLALLTKLSLAVFLPLLLAAAWLRGTTPRERLLLISTGALSAAAVSGWWFVRNLALSGDLLGYAAFRNEFAGQPFDWLQPAAWLTALLQLLSSSWAVFGWQTLPAPTLLQMLAGLAACALSVGAWRVRRTLGWPLAALGLSLLWLLAFVAGTGLVGWQGRLLWPALAAVALLAGAGYTALTAQLPPTPRRSLAAAGTTLLLLCAVWLPFGVIAPAYPRSALDPAAAQALPDTPIGVQLGDYGRPELELHGVQFASPFTGGETLTVTVTWHSLAVIEQPYQVFVHLSTRAGAIVAETNVEVLGGTRPFTRWTPGDWFQDQYLIAVPADLRNGRYRLIVGLWDPTSGRRLGVYNSDGQLVDAQVDIGMLRVRR